MRSMECEQCVGSKVYQLNQDGAWEDQGTGYAAILNKYIVVHAEEVCASTTGIANC